jgi:hypothetical protein
MKQPHRPVIAYHLILTCYGFWLPNDPRGSGSIEVWSEALRQFGPATKVNSQRSVAGKPHDKNLRRAAKKALKHPPIRFTGLQAQTAVAGFQNYIEAHELRCYACAILPDHAHLVLSGIRRPIEKTAIGFKSAAVHELLVRSLHSYQEIDEAMRPKIWARGCRHIFLFDDQGIRRSERYTNDNPLNYGLKRQHWSFVRSLDSH